MQNIRKLLPVSAVAALLLLLAVSSAAAKEAAAAALVTCGAALVPSLLPFYTAANLLLNIGLPPAGKTVSAVMRRVYGLPADAAAVIALGLVGGYPVGAAAVATLFRQGKLSKEDALRLSAFCNNAGPAFIIGAAGLTVFGSTAIGLMLSAIHAVSALLTGLFFRAENEPFTKARYEAADRRSLAEALPEAVRKSAESMLMICAYVVFFSAALAAVKALPPVHLFTALLSEHFPVGEAFLCGVCELSCGILLLDGCVQAQALIAASVLLGFGGICVMLQSAAVLSAVGLPIKKMLFGKLTQALIAGLLTGFFCAFRAGQRLILPAAVTVILFFCIILKIRARKSRHNLLS